jgi:hypothetical protein
MRDATEAATTGSGAADDRFQVIELRLCDIHDLFDMSSTDLFSEYRNFLTGVDYCISELRSRRSSKPVRLDIRIPAEQLVDGLAERVSYSLRRYCEHRIQYNRRERSALRLDGVTALRIGIPITILGLLMTVTSSRFEVPDDDAFKLVLDHLGWVLAWIGLWFPLDSILFYPHAYSRETRVLRLLHDADIVLGPRRTSTLMD